jgi:hypothetical protein
MRDADIVVPENPTRRARSRAGRSGPHLALVGLGLGSLALLVLAWQFHAPLAALAALLAQFIQDEAALIRLLLKLLLLLLPIAGGLWFREHLRRLRLRADREAIITLPHGHPVHLDHLTRGDLNRYLPLTLHEHHTTERQWAAHSSFQNLHSYSVRQDYRTLAPPPPTASPAPSDTPALPTAPRFTPDDLAQQPGLLIGEDAAGDAHHIDLSACGTIGIGGQPRVGKTTTARLLLAQIAAQGGHIALCDPHGQHDQGLLQQCAPISGACIRQAVAPDEISEAILFVDKIGSQRTRQGRGGQPVVLVIDEFTALVLRQALPDDILLRLTAMAVEYAKFNLHILLIAHDWSKAALGSLGTPLRRAITHRIIHRSDMQNAEFLLPNAALARQVPTLTTGQALSWSDTGPVTLAVPLVDDATLRAAARGRPPQPYVPGAKLHLLAPATPSAPAPAPTPARPASLDDRIIELLRHSADPLDGNAVAAHLAADLQQVRNALTRLSQSRQLARSGTARNYRYTTADNHTTNGDAASSG